MNISRVLFLVGSVAAFAGCSLSEKVVKAEPGSGEIKVVRADDKPFRCQVLGDIKGSSRSEDKEKARSGAENDFKNQALKFKANYALIETDRSNPSGAGNSDTETVLLGKALKCEDAN